MWTAVSKPDSYNGTNRSRFGGIIKLYKSANFMSGEWTTEKVSGFIHCYFKLPENLKYESTNKFEVYQPLGAKWIVRGAPVWGWRRKIVDSWNMNRVYSNLQTDKYLRLPFCECSLADDYGYQLLYFYPITEL